MSCRIFLTFVVCTIVGVFGANMFQLEKRREDQIKILQQTCLSEVSRKNIRYINSLKKSTLWKTLGVPIAGMSAGSDPFDESGYEAPGGLLECEGFESLKEKFAFPNTLKVRRTNGMIEDGWTLNCFHLFFMVDRNQETDELIFYENGKPRWVYEVISPCRTLSKKIEIQNLELNCEKDDYETIAKIRALSDLCNIISEDTEFQIMKKAQLFLSKILKEKREKISELCEFYSNSNNVDPSYLELVGLEGFVKSENPTKIPTQWTSDKDYVFTGNPSATWTIKKTAEIKFSKTSGKWKCYFVSCFGNLGYQSIEVLRTALAPEDHFRVYAFIELLNFIQSHETLDE